MVAALLAVGFLPLFAAGFGAEAGTAASHGSITVFAGCTQCNAFNFATFGSVYVHNCTHASNGKDYDCTHSDDDFLSFHSIFCYKLLE